MASHTKSGVEWPLKNYGSWQILHESQNLSITN